ncbi:transposase [Patescibacteria group bacterium]|nr:transposase [Patescibacteria group bacterium]MBU4347580.1 transposase [Patescibacteria group bacterium]
MAVRVKIANTNNEIYFITFTILDWKHIFISDKYCSLVYKWFDYMRDKYGNKIYGYAIMPNHLHCIIKLSTTAPDISKVVQNAKRFLAYGIVAQLKEDGNREMLNFFKAKADVKSNAKHKVFKKRFDSLIIQSQKFFLQKLNYIHNNPCHEKWNLAENPEEYLYSSASNYILGKGYYAVDIMDF